MSRRIYPLAVLAVLFATPALADPECYSASCHQPDQPHSRMPDVADPPAEVIAAPDLVETELPVLAAPRAAAPTRAHPQMVVDPAARPGPPPPRYSVDAGPRQIVRQAPRYERYEESGPVRVVNQGRYPARVVANPGYVMNQGPAYGGGVVVVVPGPVQYDEGVMPAYVSPDPAWKLCQFGEPERPHKDYHCGPYSYHPYGAPGYRPYGSYRPQANPGYIVAAPDARVIVIED